MSHDLEMATSSGMSGMSGTFDMRTSTIGSEGEIMDDTSLPLSVSSDTAFTSFYGSQKRLTVPSITGRTLTIANINNENAIISAS